MGAFEILAGGLVFIWFFTGIVLIMMAALNDAELLQVGMLAGILTAIMVAFIVIKV